MQTAQDIRTLLQLAPHPEGGWFRQTFRDTSGPEGRGASTAIYYLLESGERSHWHHVDAVETWHYYAGAPLILSLSSDGVGQTDHILGSDLTAGQRPQVIVPKHVWQAARSMGDWTLVGCTVAPGFTFDGFTLAPPEWQPGP